MGCLQSKSIDFSTLSTYYPVNIIFFLAAQKCQMEQEQLIAVMFLQQKLLLLFFWLTTTIRPLWRKMASPFLLPPTARSFAWLCRFSSWRNSCQWVQHQAFLNHWAKRRCGQWFSVPERGKVGSATFRLKCRPLSSSSATSRSAAQ